MFGLIPVYTFKFSLIIFQNNNLKIQISRIPGDIYIKENQQRHQKTKSEVILYAHNHIFFKLSSK